MFGRLQALLGALYRQRPNLFIFAVLGYLIVIGLAVVSIFIPLPFAGTWIPLLLVAPVLILAAMYRALSRASRIFTNWYDTPPNQAFTILLAHAYKGGYPKVRAAKGKVDLDAKTEEEKQAIRAKMNAGVPLLLTLDADTAVLTEKAGRPHKVYVQPGAHVLEPFEEVRYAIDRRAHAGMKAGINALTRDGIAVTLDVAVAYQIKRQGTPSVENPYPVDRAALFRAVYRRAVAAGAHEPEPLDVVVPNMVAGPARNIVAQYRLSELYEPPHGRPEAEAVVPRTEVGKKIAESLAEAAENLGLDILSANVVNIEVPDEEVRKHIFEQWAREREHEIEKRMSPEQARRKANEMAIMLQTLEGVKDDNVDLGQFVQDVRELYYIMLDLAEFIESEEAAGRGGALAGRAPWSAEGLRRRLENYAMFQDIETGRYDTPDEKRLDADLKRRFPHLVDDE